MTRQRKALRPLRVGLLVGIASVVAAVPAHAATPRAALIVVRGLAWAERPAGLGGFAKGNLSLRAADPHASPAEGYLTLGKGDRAGLPSQAHGLGPVAVGAEASLRVEDWPALRHHDASLGFAGHIG